MGYPAGRFPAGSVEVAAGVGGAVGGRRAGGVDVGHFEHDGGRPQVAADVDVVGAGGVGDGIAEIADTFNAAVADVAGQGARL